MLLAEFVICDDDATLPANGEALDCCESDLARPSCDITEVNVCDITVGVLAAATCMAVISLHSGRDFRLPATQGKHFTCLTYGAQKPWKSAPFAASPIRRR